jgi:hypothetical protein
MTWWLSSAWLRRVCRKWRNPQRRHWWVKNLSPQLEPLEERRLFTNNVWLPQRLAPLDGTSQYNQTTQLFVPAPTGLQGNLQLQSTSVAVSGSFSLTVSGNFSLSLNQSGPYDGSGDRYTFAESGTITFALTELGTFSATGFSTTSVTLSETAALSWSFAETDGSGQTVQSLSGTNTFTAQGSGAAPFDPYFPAGYNWLDATQKLSTLNSLGLSGLSADSLAVHETSGNESYTFLQTNAVATVQGNILEPVSEDLAQTGHDSYSDSSVDQSADTLQGTDSFSLTELGQYANNSYALSSVAYQEQGGTQTFQQAGTTTDTRSGNGSTTASQAYSGHNHTLGNSSSDSFQLSALSTGVYGESGSGSYSLYQAGCFGSGSFSLGSLTYNNNGSGNYSLSQNATQTQTGTYSAGSNASGTDSYGISGSLTGTGTATRGGPFTYVANDTVQDSESGN